MPAENTGFPPLQDDHEIETAIEEWLQELARRSEEERLGHGW